MPIGAGTDIQFEGSRTRGGSSVANAQTAFGGGGGGTPDQIAANMTRDQWQHFLDTYKPVEDEVLRKAMQTDFTAEGDQAGATAAAGVNASRGSLARSLSRSGATLTTEESNAIRRRQQNSLTKAVSRAENTTRRGLKESRSQLLAGVVNIGRGVANTAQAGAQNVAGLAAQREAQHQQGKAATSAANMSAAASVAALAIMFI